MSTSATSPRIALAGNPNCGKTTLFNALTGLRHKVANYPGVTVEKKTGAAKLPGIGDALIIDLPGIYSLSAHSLDEIIASKALLGELKDEPLPDLIVSVVDASNLERNLYLTTQLLDLGIPTVIALNMSDVAHERGILIKKELLSRALDAPVVALTANKKEGVTELVTTMSTLLASSKISHAAYGWLGSESSYRSMAQTLGESLTGTRSPASILRGSSLLSESTIAPEGSLAALVVNYRNELSTQGIDPLSFEATRRYEWINTVVKQSVAIEDPEKKYLSDKVDSIIVHPLWGTLIFLAIMTVIFQSIFLWASIPMGLIDSLFTWLSSEVSVLLEPGDLQSLLVDGIIPGVGSVVIFVPQIAILFLCLGILEDSGYLSRAAFLMDKIMRKVGLQGRSFIPLLSSFACAIPGIMSTRTIPSFSDRMTTILVAPLMSCSARIPVYTLLIGAFVPQDFYLGFVSLQGLVLLGMYLLGVIGAAGVAWVLKFFFFKGEPALFVMEMPPFRVPALKTILRDIIDRVFLFLKSAGTVILACSILLWFLASYPKGEVEESYAGKIGMFMEPAIKPLGFNWEVGVGILASFAAREVFVSSLATVYNIAEKDEGDSHTLMETLKARHQEGRFSTLSALSLMVFYVFACMCMSTLAVCKRETGSWRWTGFMFFYMTALAYVLSLATYQVGILFIP